jgi:hypothetical protein
LAVAVAAASGGDAVAAEVFVKGPYLQNASPSSITVMWETQQPEVCRVELVGAGRSIATDERELQEVVLDRLEPGRRYRYAVSCGATREEGEFATAPDGPAPFMFVVFGDSRSNAQSHQAVVERIQREVPDFIIGTGDMVNQGGADADWQQFFDIERELLRDNVMFPSLGNHDRQGRGRTADSFRTYFAVPENSPDPERYYAFTYGNARFLVLDSNTYSFALTDQTAWIEQQLQAARLDRRIEHIFVSMHHPPYSISLHGGHQELRDAWTPLFQKYGVSAVFSGHDHCYERAEADGVRYFVSGGGGAPLYPRSQNPSERDLAAVKYIERTNHYLRAHVVGGFVEITAFRADGTIIESMSWGKMPGEDRLLVALAGVGAGDHAGANDGPGALPEVTPAEAAVVAPAAGGGSSRFGLLGKLGAVMMLVAGGVLVWGLRQ